MGKGLVQIEGLKKDGVRWVRLRWASLRLAAADKISCSLSKAFGYGMFILLLLNALAFMMVALALWVGEMLDSLALGFLIAGGGFLAGALFMYFFGGRLVINTLIRGIIDFLFTEDDTEDGTQE